VKPRLSEPIAVALWLGHLLDLPEHPDEGGAQTDNDAQEKQRQTWGCEHGEHSTSKASGVPANGIKRSGLGANTPRPLENVPIGPTLKFI
jgi:hypothetical protein